MTGLYQKYIYTFFLSLSRTTITFLHLDSFEEKSFFKKISIFFSSRLGLCDSYLQSRSFSTSRIWRRSISLFVIADNQEWQSKWYLCKRHGVSRRWIGELSVATLALRNVNLLLLLLLLLLPTPSDGICQGHGPRKTRCRSVTRHRRRRSQSHRWFY